MSMKHGWSIFVGALAVGTGLIYITTRHSDESVQACRQKMKFIGSGFHQYHDANQHFPSALSTSKPHHSWRIALLPWLGEQELYQQYDQSTAWDSPANQRLLNARPTFYACPETTNSLLTSYQAAVSIRSAWPYDMQLQMRDFFDGPSNTVLMIDSHNPEVEWTAPQDLNMSQASAAIKNGQQHSDSSSGQVTQVLLADGSVKLIANTIDGDLRRALLTPAGGRLPLQPLSAIAQNFSSLESHPPATKKFPAPRDSASWPGVVMWPTAIKEIDSSNSIVYCPNTRGCMETVYKPNLTRHTNATRC